MSSSYVSRFGNRPYLLFTAILAIVIGLYGIATAITSWVWVGLGDFRLAYMSVVTVTTLCISLDVIALWYWAIQAIRYHRMNPLPTPPEPAHATGGTYFFPAGSFRILAIIYGVICVPMLGVAPATMDVIADVHVALAVAIAILFIVSSFVAPRRWLILLSSICVTVLLPFSITAFSFSIIYGIVDFRDSNRTLVSYSTSMGALQAVQTVVGFIWSVYGFRFVSMSSNGFLPPPQQGPSAFPKRRLVAFSCITFILSIATITASAFSCVAMSIVYMSLGAVVSILMIVASSIRPRLGLIFVSGFLSCLYMVWSITSMFSSLSYSALYLNCSGGAITVSVFAALQLAFVGSWALLALEWFHYNNDERLPAFPSVIMRTISIFLMISMSVSLIVSSVSGYVYGIVYTALSLLLTINMTVASFMNPNRVYLLVCAVFGIANLIANIADLGLAISGLTVLGSRQLLNILPTIFVAIFSVSSNFFALLTWIIFAFMWYHKAQHNFGMAVGISVQADETEALRNTVTQLSNQVEILTNRLQQQQQQPDSMPQQGPTSTPYY